MEFLEQYDPPGLRLTPVGRQPGLLTPQVGGIAEDELAIGILLAFQGSVSIGVPLVDQGFDGYVRRLRTMRVVPYQLKARRTLTASGSYVAYLPVRAVRDDPTGALVFVYMPVPRYALHRRLYVIPVRYFIEHCPRDKTTGRTPAQYVFRGHLDGQRHGPFDQFLFDLNDLGSCWLEPLLGKPDDDRAALAVPPVAKPALGGYGELWLASELQRLGTDRIVVARHRVDVDAVDLLVHDLRIHRFGGLQVKTATINAGRVEFRLPQATYFVDPRLLVAILPCLEDGRLAGTAFVIPSAAISSLTSTTRFNGRPAYVGHIRVDRITDAIKPHTVALSELGSTILGTMFG